MMATLRRFMALLLVVQRSTRDLAGKPGSTFPDRALKPGIRWGAFPQKGSPAKRTGHTLRVAAQYIQKTSKNNGLFLAKLTESQNTVKQGVSGLFHPPR